MASILDRYGIKEVADVTFYKLDDTGKPTNPVLYLDTLKVSNIEQTAETTDAKGGKGNAPLITWDYGKEINVTLEDALFSIKSMAMMFGDGKVRSITTTAEEVTSGGQTTTVNRRYIMKTEKIVVDYTGDGATIQSGAYATGTAGSNFKTSYVGPNGTSYKKLNPKFYSETGEATNTLSKGATYFCTYDVDSTGSVVEVSANTFPGTYYVTGDTFARSEANGEDEFFQFIIPKAKITSENTLTLEAEGDPTVFSMNLKVLRPADGVMMKLVKYTLADGTNSSEASTSSIIHNHSLATPAAG